MASSNPHPKILLAKPALVTSSSPVAGKYGPRGGGGGGGGGGNGGGGGDDYNTASFRSRLPSSINLLSDSWDFHIDRFLPFLTENTEFTVVGVIGPPGVGKSTIMNEIYGFDEATSSPGMLPPFAIETEEGKAMARHCSVGIEPRVSSERIILLDTQPVLSPSVLAEMMRPDGSSTVPVLSGETLSAELAHEMMGIQLGVLLTSICHVFLVISEGVHDRSMWCLMSTVDLLKHGIPDPSSHTLSHPQSSNIGPEKDSKIKVPEGGEYMALPIFVHTKLRDHDLSPHSIVQLRKTLKQYTSTSSFTSAKSVSMSREHSMTSMAPGTQSHDPDSLAPKLYVIPMKSTDDFPGDQYESYTSMLWKLRDQVLSMHTSSFRKTVTERDWLKNSAKIWELVKSSPIIAEYSRTLQSSGMFRR